MLFPLQVMEGDEQAKAWVALDESTPSPLPFQRRVIYESPEDDPLLVYGFQINLLSYRNHQWFNFLNAKQYLPILSLPPLHKG